MVTEPKYDGDLVNKAYVDSLLGAVNVTLDRMDYNKNFGAQPIPPYYVNDTYMDGTDVYICVTERLIGDFNSADWEVASEYVKPAEMQTYVAGEITELTSYVDGLVDDLQDQIDGVMEFWFYEGEPTLLNLPASEWLTDAVKNEHIGDIYVDMLTSNSYRFVYYDSAYSWLQQSDSQAAAAYALAEDAFAVADNKRRVFYGTPTTPYEIGDLWSQGPNAPLKICITALASGTYVSGHWVLASDSDNTSTVIAGGLVTTGSLVVKDGANNQKAGITGNTTSAGGTDVRIWAGNTMANRNDAPFRVTQDGYLYATQGRFLTGCKVGGWDIDGSNIKYGTTTTLNGSNGNIATSSLTATGGTIGGWNVDSTGIKYGTTNAGAKGMLSNNTYAFYAGHLTPASAPFRVTQAGALVATNANITGAITATSGTFDNCTINGTSSINSAAIPNLSAGKITSGMLDIYNGTGFLRMGYAGSSWTNHPYVSALNVASYAADPSSSGPGISFRNSTTRTSAGTQIGYISYGYNGAGRYYSNGNMNLAAGGAIGLDGSYVRIESLKFNGTTLYNDTGLIKLYAYGGNSLWGQGNSLSSSRIMTAAGQSSSRNLKENIKEFDEKVYNESVELLKKIKIYEYDYKYPLYKDKHQFGFIIDELEEQQETKKFFKFDEVLADISDNGFNSEVTDDKTLDKKNLPDNIIKYKQYDPDVLDKYLLTCLKAQQMKIDELEKRLEILEKG